MIPTQLESPRNESFSTVEYDVRPEEERCSDWWQGVDGGDGLSRGTIRLGRVLVAICVCACLVGAYAFFSSDVARDGVIATNIRNGAYPEITALDRKIAALYQYSQQLATEGRAIDGTNLSLAMRMEYDKVNGEILSLMQKREALMAKRGYRGGK